jgi:ribonuclease PH
LNKSYQRQGGRKHDQLRPVEIETGWLKFAEGSALIRAGDTRVLAAASVERRVPPFRFDTGLGWVTGEYSMLPRATHTRSRREVSLGRPSGRTSEIQRLIGRSLRAAVDMSRIPDLTITVDCDVLQADGGTRTASITAGYVAMVEALASLFLAGDLDRWPVTHAVAAISVGLVEDTPLLDLEYVEDSVAQVDLNVVGNAKGELIEIQGTGEQRGFSRAEHDTLLGLAEKGLRELFEAQNSVLADTLDAIAEVQSGDGGRRRRRSASPRDEAELWSKPSK